MDTIDPMVVPDPSTGATSYGDDETGESPPPPPPLHPLVQRFWWVLPILVAVVTLGVVLDTDLPYYALAPGKASEVDELIHAPQDRLHPSRGEIYLATVSLQRVKPLGALRGWLDRSIDVVPDERILGTTPPAQYRRQNLQLMDESKQTAMVVALRQLGYDVPEQGKGALVVEVSAGSPAADRLRPGDTITAIDGTATTLVSEAVARIQAHRPGDVTRLEVTNADGTARVEQIALTENTENERRRGQAFLGVLMRTKDRTFPMPFDVTIESGRIGGPSAGLAFTLALIEQLAPAELTGGHKVAVTGTIDIEGVVGEVGGVAQKTAAVRSEGAEYFFVPPGEFEVAKQHAGKRLKVVSVANLQEAIDAMGRIGGDVTGASKVPQR